jgi:hypothetical protein
MFVAFPEEGVAESDSVLRAAVLAGGIGIGEPQVHAIEKVKPGTIRHLVAAWLVVGPEESCRGKNSLKAFDDPAVMPAVFGEVKELKHLSGAAEPDRPAFLPERKSCDPDRDKPILAVRQAKARMTSDFQEELSIAAQIRKLFAKIQGTYITENQRRRR